MYRTDIASAMGANVAYCKFTIGFQDLTVFAAASQAIPLVANALSNIPALFNIPQGGAMLGVGIHHTVPFAGTGITAMTVSLGAAGNVSLYANPFNIFQPAANTTFQNTQQFAMSIGAATTVLANFIATGANLALLTAGSVDIYIYWINVSTPGV